MSDNFWTCTALHATHRRSYLQRRVIQCSVLSYDPSVLFPTLESHWRHRPARPGDPRGMTMRLDEPSESQHRASRSPSRQENCPLTFYPLMRSGRLVYYCLKAYFLPIIQYSLEVRKKRLNPVHTLTKGFQLALLDVDTA